MGGGKQGSWREANGPTKIGFGFKGAGRGGKSGVQCWRLMLLGKGPAAVVRPTTKSNESQFNIDSSRGLKAVLGVTEFNDNSSIPERVALAQESDSSMGLKSLLGVSPMSLPEPALAAPP